MRRPINPFMPGDVIRAKDDNLPSITYGKHYTVISNPDEDGEDYYVYVNTDDGSYDGFLPEYVELVSHGVHSMEPEMSLDEIHLAQEIMEGLT